MRSHPTVFVHPRLCARAHTQTRRHVYTTRRLGTFAARRLRLSNEDGLEQIGGAKSLQRCTLISVVYETVCVADWRREEYAGPVKTKKALTRANSRAGAILSALPEGVHPTSAQVEEVMMLM